MPHKTVDRDTWTAARLELLAQEKVFQRERDRLAAARRALPRVRIEKEYTFEGEDGAVTLGELFGPHSQLIIYHFMYHPDWEEGCKSCSFWADNFERSRVHLAARDVALAAVSSAPFAKLLAYRSRMDWTFPWVSSGKSGFNQDFHVTFTPEQVADGNAYYNFRDNGFVSEEAPGISVFAKDPDSTIYHTYSTYSRGLDPFNATYQYLDIVPKGRNEKELSWPMEWLRRNDEY